MRLCHEAGFAPTIVQEANEIATICALVDAGLGVAIVPSSVDVIAPSGVVYRALEPHAELERWAVWRDGVQTGVIRAFVAMLAPQ
jgi:DNA-binding transcriptional LysR family regulator